MLSPDMRFCERLQDAAAWKGENYVALAGFDAQGELRSPDKLKHVPRKTPNSGLRDVIRGERDSLPHRISIPS